MSKHLLWAIVLVTMPAGIAAGQATDANPAHKPSVFLGNDLPKEKKDKAPTSRTVTGKVVDSGGQPLEGALVTLTDTQSHEKTTIITKKDGRYGFGDLSFTIDYELQARYKDLTSELKKLSQYDHKPNVVRILEVGPSEAKKEPPQPKQ
jgi:hypothetical protein